MPLVQKLVPRIIAFVYSLIRKPAAESVSKLAVESDAEPAMESDAKSAAESAS